MFIMLLNIIGVILYKYVLYFYQTKHFRSLFPILFLRVGPDSQMHSLSEIGEWDLSLQVYSHLVLATAK